MALFAERKRLEQLEAAEAVGKSFLTDQFDDVVRTKLKLAIRDQSDDYVSSDDIVERAHWLICRDLGIDSLTTNPTSPSADIYRAVSRGDTSEVATVLEAVFTSLGQVWNNWHYAEQFEHRVNDILARHRITFEMVEGQMVEIESQELHAEIVSPLLHLLSGRSGWAGVESAYQEALEQIAVGKPDNAVTDAARALQEALIVSGCAGNSLGPLIDDGRKRNLIANHDAKIFHWVSAERSERGDGHHASDATREDAWLTVHVAGALILRLAQRT
jgi:AbiJ N-terminal domain 4